MNEDWTEKWLTEEERATLEKVNELGELLYGGVRRTMLNSLHSLAALRALVAEQRAYHRRATTLLRRLLILRGGHRLLAPTDHYCAPCFTIAPLLDEIEELSKRPSALTEAEMLERLK